MTKPISKPLALKLDSSAVQQRTFNEKAIADYKKQRDFTYDDVAPAKLSLWSRFWRWFWENFMGALDGPNIGPILGYLFIALGVGAIVFAAFKLAGVDIKLLAKKSKNIEVPYEESLENIHEINFDDQLEVALAQKNYRLAVRLLYLKSLKHLSDQKLIDWKLEKTNQAYVSEIENEVQRSQFKQLTNQFEYIWYGEFFIDGLGFEKINQSFHQFNQEVR